MIIKPRGWIASLSLIWSSSLFAANNPVEATDDLSSGDFDIELLIPPLAQIGFPLALTNIDFGGFDETFGFQDQRQWFCIFHNTATVTLVADSNRSASNGRFVLAHSSTVENVLPGDAEGIEYLVEVVGQGGQESLGGLTAGVPTPDFAAANARETDIPDCSEASANMELRLRLAGNINFNQKNVGAYSDELTLTVAAE
ncbi:hypothetical protein [Endozoicomonas sp. Mp262]|uniref:hypothetical protein n=1 Tax=Endozoicomonas sp. Mp262 TaxID=2919499 RepID=UPI0021DAD1D7